jgi:hypothetical protein
MRYDQPATNSANWPKKDKLPAGASYTCLLGGRDEIGMPYDSSSDEDSSEEEEVEES